MSAFEMWIWQLLIKTKCTDHKTDEEMLYIAEQLSLIDKRNQFNHLPVCKMKQKEGKWAAVKTNSRGEMMDQMRSRVKACTSNTNTNHGIKSGDTANLDGPICLEEHNNVHLYCKEGRTANL